MSADIGDASIIHGQADVGCVGGASPKIINRSAFGGAVEFLEKFKRVEYSDQEHIT